VTFDARRNLLIRGAASLQNGIQFGGLTATGSLTDAHYKKDASISVRACIGLK